MNFFKVILRRGIGLGMLRSRDERRITKPMQQAVDRVERPELAKFVLQNPLYVFAAQRAYAIVRQRAGVEASSQLFPLPRASRPDCGRAPL